VRICYLNQLQLLVLQELIGKNFPKFETPTIKPPRVTCSFLYHKELRGAVRWLDNQGISCLSTAVGDSITKVNWRDGTEVIEVDDLTIFT